MKTFPPRTRTNLAVRIALFLPLLLLAPQDSLSQSFGVPKKKVVLHRKLPAAVHLAAGTVAIRMTGVSSQVGLAELLGSILETDLLKNNKDLQIEKSESADVVISCVITHFEEPPPQVSVRNETVYQKGKAVQQPKTYYTIRGVLDVAFKATNRSGKTLDSNSFSAKYSREFEQGTNQATSGAMSIPGIFKNPGGLFHHNDNKKGEIDESTPPTAEQLRQSLVKQVASQIAARLVNTDEPVEVLLARGKLNDANKLAESGLWSRNLEALETMPSLASPQDDAYRLYNIGVAYEALAYQSEERGQAKKFLEQAAINYGKAIEAKREEKYFLEPQNRIETAIAHYKKLENQETGSSSAMASSSSAPSSRGVDNGAGAKGEPAPLTNEKIIEMYKSGVDPDDIVAAIQQAPVIQFDTSPDGLIELAKNGVKGKIPAAMRARARAPKTARVPK